MLWKRKSKSKLFFLVKQDSPFADNNPQIFHPTYFEMLPVESQYKDLADTLLNQVSERNNIGNSVGKEGQNKT